MDAKKRHFLIMCAIALIAGFAITLIAEKTGERVADAIQEMR